MSIVPLMASNVIAAVLGDLGLMIFQRAGPGP
jgi:hypothetical protein